MILRRRHSACLSLLLFGSIVLTGSTCSLAGDRGRFGSAQCEGSYRHHLQGVCTNGEDAVYWSFTTTLVKTDVTGKLIKQVPVGNHHGDLCCYDGKLYVAVNFGRFNDAAGRADSWVYVYDAGDLTETARHKVGELIYGAGGIAYQSGRFFVVGGLPADIEENYVYEYDEQFRFIRKHVVKSGHTHLGIQTATVADGHFWFGCYGNPKILLKTDASFQTVKRFEFDCSLGIESLGGGNFLVARGNCNKQRGCLGEITVETSKRFSAQ